MGEDKPIVFFKYSLSIGERDVCGVIPTTLQSRLQVKDIIGRSFVHALAIRGGSVSYSPDIVLIESGISLKSILESHLNPF